MLIFGDNMGIKSHLLSIYRVATPNLSDRHGHNWRQIFGINQGSLYMQVIKIIDSIIDYIRITNGGIVVLGALVPSLI